MAMTLMAQEKDTDIKKWRATWRAKNIKMNN